MSGNIMSQSRSVDKDYDLFDLFSGLEFHLDETLEKSESKIKEILKLFPIKNKNRDQIKIAYNMVRSIRSAMERIEPVILNQDLDRVKDIIDKVFEDFKRTTGIDAPRKKEKKQKKICLNSFEQLNSMNEIREQYEEVEASSTFLQNNLEELQERWKDNNNSLIFEDLPILVVGYVENMNQVKLAGISVENSNYGYLWSPCKIAVVKDIEVDIDNICKEAREKFGINYASITEIYKSGYFPGYSFCWLQPVSLTVSWGRNFISSWTLPLPNKMIKPLSKERTAELRKLRLEREELKKKVKEEFDAD